MSDLTTVEQNRLESLEDTIAKGMRSFMAVGVALAEINEKRLYRAQHDTFEDYCRDRWDFTAARGRQLMAAVEAIASLPEDAPKPANAAQASALAEVEPEQRADVWDRARREAESEGRDVTARDIREASEEPAKSVPSLTAGGTAMTEVDPLFKRALAALKEASDCAEALSKSSAKAWLLTSGSALLKHIRDARDHVRAARPAGECPVCGGHGCPKCMSTGWVNRTRMDSLREKA